VLTLIPVVVGLALIDSINPSAIGMTIYLLLSRQRYLPAVACYLLGVFGTYFAAGIALVYGASLIAGDGRTWWYSPWAYAIEACVGVALLVYSFAAPKQKPPSRRQSQAARAGAARLILLGAIISMVEFATALPYLAAIALLVRAELGWGSVALLVLYNAVMNLPPVLLVIAYRISASRWRRRLENWQARLSQGSRATWLWIAGILGALPLVDSAWFFLSTLLHLTPANVR
jgi:cytochrome c biogenesis protein CcdA